MLHIFKRMDTKEEIRDFSLRLLKGDIHGLLGDRQTGKTLIAQMLSGQKKPDQGEIRLDQERARLNRPRDAAVWGIGVADGLNAYVSGFDLMDHLLLGAEYAPSGKIRKKKVRLQAKEIIQDFGLPFDLDALPEEMTQNQWLWAQILRFILQEKDVLILDEPDRVLSSLELKELNAVLLRLSQAGVTTLVLSQSPETVLALCDGVTVLRKNARPVSFSTEEITSEQLKAEMGVLALPQKKEVTLGSVALEVRQLTALEADEKTECCSRLSFEARTGEIMCLLGRSPQGWDALLQALTGARRAFSGRIRMDGKEITVLSPWEFKKAGIAWVSREASKTEAIADLTVEENLLLDRYAFSGFQEGGWLLSRRRRENALDILERHALFKGVWPRQYPDDLTQGTLRLLLLNREMENKPSLLIVDSPYYGMNPKEAEAMREQLFLARASRCAVLILTNEVQDALELADRIMVLHRGEAVGEFLREDTFASELGLYMNGQRRQHRFGGMTAEGEDE